MNERKRVHDYCCPRAQRRGAAARARGLRGGVPTGRGPGGDGAGPSTPLFIRVTQCYRVTWVSRGVFGHELVGHNCFQTRITFSVLNIFLRFLVR